MSSNQPMPGHERIPPGPAERYDGAQDLLAWINELFNRYGDIYRASVFGSNVYVISAPAYAEHVLLKNWQNYARKGQVVKRIALLLGNGLIASNGAFWASQRRMIQPAFTHGAIDALAGVIERANGVLLQKWREAARRQAAVNVTRDVSEMVLEVTLSAIFGDDYAAVAPHFSLLTEESARNLQFAQAFSPIGKMIVQLAAERRAQGRSATDMLGVLMDARDREHGRPMPDPQLAREIMTLVVAGHETTASALNWTWYLLAKYPEVDARLAEELGRLLPASVDGMPPPDAFPRFTYTIQVIDEALRSYPPLWLMTRHALRDDHLGEYFVPAGTEIYISPYLIQRHPGLWEEPDRFDPGRFDPKPAGARHRLATCPFGAGPRNCIGEYFAKTEMQIHLMMIARELRLAYQPAKAPDVVAGMNLLSRDDFWMTPELRAGADH